MFLVDAKDPERFQESKVELDALLSMEELQKTPFLVLGNKIDHPAAVSEEQLRHELGLFQTSKLRAYNSASHLKAATRRRRYGHAATESYVLTLSQLARARFRSRASGPSRSSCARLSCARATARASAG